MLSNTATPIWYAYFRSLVLNGEIKINRKIELQMYRIDAKIANPDYYYDDQAINGYINFVEREMVLRDGSQFKLLWTFKLWAEDLLAWFYYPEEKVYNQETECFDTIRKKTRLCTKQYLIVARGASKSMYAATLQMYFLVMYKMTTDQLIVAPTMAQAYDTLSPLKTALTVKRGPLFKYLSEGSKTSSNESLKPKLAPVADGIVNTITNSKIFIRPMRIDKLQGLGTLINSVDEWKSGEVKEDVIGAIEQGAGKTGNEYVIIATSSEGTVRDGTGDTIEMELTDILEDVYQDDHTSIFHYRLDDISEVNDPSSWEKANPNIGSTISYESYQRDVALAESQPAKRNDILAKRFGIPVEGYTYFFTYEETLKHGKQNFDNMLCSVGADLSQGDDFTAFTFLFPLSNGKFGIKTRAYVSENKYLKLPKAMQQKYDSFVYEDTLTIMPGGILDMMTVFEDLYAFIITHQYQTITIGYDPYNAFELINAWERSFGSYGIEKVRQGVITESVPLGELKAMSEMRNLVFDEELMKFAMGNAVVIEDNNGNYKLSKKRSFEKIDNVSALMDAWVAYKRHAEAFQ